MENSDTNCLQLLTSKKKGQAAFSLVEVTMAVGLVAFCLVAMMGVLPVGLMQERGSSEQLGAMQVLAAVESDFQHTSTDGLTLEYKINPGQKNGSFYVDQSFQHTDQEANAEYNVWYEIADAVSGQASQRMHLFVARVRPSGLALQNVLAEGIAQKRLN